MNDVLTPAQRSHCMSRNRGTRTSPEERLRKALWQAGYRYRIHHGLPGKPDIVFPSKKLVIFVDGCFWHGCQLHYQAPRNNAAFWAAKIDANRRRDQLVTTMLETSGWCVLRFWEHEVKQDLVVCVTKIVQVIKSSETQCPAG